MAVRNAVWIAPARALALVALALLVALLGPVGSTTASGAAGSVGHRQAGPPRVAADPLLVHIDVDQPLDAERRRPSRSRSPGRSPTRATSCGPTSTSTPSSPRPPSSTRRRWPPRPPSTPDAYVGERIVTPGTEDTIDGLDPGQTADFSLTVPRSELLVTEAGVYWLGVHASGDSSVPRDQFADGRARTFIPLVPKTRGNDPDTVETAIVVPVRETVWITPDGRVDRVGRWAKSLDVGGRLSSILGAGNLSDVPLTWLVDPAVPAAVARLAAGNPVRAITPDPDALPVEPTEEPTEEPVSPTEGAPAGARALLHVGRTHPAGRS